MLSRQVRLLRDQVYKGTVATRMAKRNAQVSMKAVPFEELWGEQAQNLSRGGGVKINVSGEESFFGVFFLYSSM